LGPGTFDTVTLNGTFTRSATLAPATTRAARAASAGVANWAKSCSRSAGMALWSRLATIMASWMVRRRATGSASSVASVAIMADTWFPMADFWSSERTDTGTMASNG